MCIAVEIRPLTTEELGIVEVQVNFDWAAHQKHRERLGRQDEGRAIYLVAWCGNIPVGHVLLEWSGTTDEPMRSQLAHCPNLEDLFVAPKYRSKGVGSRLLQEAEARAKKECYPHIGLGVAVDNTSARRLYQRQGYVDAGFGEYKTGGSYVDQEGMERTWEEICCYFVKQIRSNNTSLSPRRQR